MKKKMILGFVLALFASACGGGGGDKGLDCADGFLCVADCNSDACIEDCMNDATPAARQQMIALATCYEEAGCDDDQCLFESCGAEADACGGLDDLGKPEMMSKVRR